MSQCPFIPYCPCCYCSNALSYHTVHAAIAAGFIEFRHIPGKESIADTLTKHLEPGVLEPLLRLHLFWQGPKVEWHAKKPLVDGD